MTALYAPGNDPYRLVVVTITEDDAAAAVSVAGRVNGVGGFAQTHHLARDHPVPEVIAAT